MKNPATLIFLGLCLMLTNINAQDTGPVEGPSGIIWEQTQISYQQESVRFEFSQANGVSTLSINGEEIPLNFVNGEALYKRPASRSGELLLIRHPAQNFNRLFHLSQKDNGQVRFRPIPLWLSILPPLVAIGLALVFREVLISLFVGIWSGAFIAGGLQFGSPGFYFTSLWQVVEKYIIYALADADHMAIIVFSTLIGGMVAIISRNGGMAGIVDRLAKYAKNAQSSQLVTWVLGVAIFFDDYANTLIVGNTMRPVTDRFRVSREKLAYIVDSTAAPVAAVAFITTWIGAELGYISDSIGGLEGFQGGTAYAVFLSSLKYSFYPVLTLAFILILIFSKKDLGPMLKAERRARATGQVIRRTTTVTEEGGMEDLEPVPGAPRNWYNAFVPVALVIAVTILGLLVTGFDATYETLVAEGIAVQNAGWSGVWEGMTRLLGAESSLFNKLGMLIGNSNSYTALLWASLTGAVAAILLTLSGRIMKLGDTMNTLVTGFKTMMPALLILTLAWALAATTHELHTATFLSSALAESLNPYWMPVFIFVLAALISFSTGSSWSTMAILYPIAIPTTWAICTAQGVDPATATEILLNVIAVTLAASVLGDHCSPISDTTILSSLASDCNHIDHVRTQLPYALLVGIFSILCGGISSWLGGGWLVSFVLVVLSLVGLWVIIWRFGQYSDTVD
jgi:Na+/H+ antiporter NhaC